MKIIKTYSDSLSERQLNEIVRDLENGAIMIYPTDTLYAIGCDTMNPKAIEKICRLKGINPNKTNLSIICKDISQISEYARYDNSIYRLLRDNTPGEFTFLLKASSALPKVFKGRKVVGIRIPKSNIAISIVEKLGHPILTTSIEYEDEDYAINPDLITESYNNQVDFIIDNGNGGIEPSTIIDCSEDEPEIVRQGKGILK